MNEELVELRREIASLRAEVDASRRRIVELESTLVDRDRIGDGQGVDGSGTTERTSRRGALRLAAGAAAGAAGALLASTPAAADDPNDITLGQNKVHAGGVTRAGNTGTTDAMAFLFVAGSEGVGSGSLAPAALGGWTTQSERPNGVYGYTEKNGAGVVGIYRGNGEAVWVPHRTGVFGWTDSPDKAGVEGRGVGSRSPGVRGIGTEVGVDGICEELRGDGVRGIAARGVGGKFIGARAGIQLYDGDFADTLLSAAPYGRNPYSIGERSQGELLYASDKLSDEPVDQGLWVCVEPGDPGSWRCLAGPKSAGTLFPVTPFRVYDSRRDMAPDADGVLSVGSSRTVSAADARDVTSGVVVTADAVPARARAVAFNLTVHQVTGAGFVFLAPGGATEATASTINWTPGGSTTVANAGIVALDDQRRLTFFCGGSPDASAHVIIDISGYYL